ncbi:MAG: thiamine pyrophosphate-binding protein [Robiginitomaculum sp.]|nr:MAG: thiamine pyrophosphate-binding protein [Robiginitomaculum sp.]
MYTQTGGDLIAQMLKAEGVDTVFGIIDGTYVQLTAAFKKHGIALITPRHESSAAHMAGAYARLTGKLGVCIASNGPGVANILPGIATENGEGNRVLVITSWRRRGIINPDRGGTFQYFNQVGAIKPIAKWSGAAEEFTRIPEIMRRAFRISHEGRPGVVHVTVPEDVINSPSEAKIPPLTKPENYRTTTPVPPSPAQINKAADMLEHAKMPMIQAGSGVLHAKASEELATLAEMLQAPVTTSWGGRASIDERRAVSVPLMHTEMVDKIRNESDVVLALGTRFGETDWWGKPPYWARPEDQALIQVDCDAQIIGMNKPVTLGILSDAKTFLNDLIAELKARKLNRTGSVHETRVQAYHKARMENGEAAIMFMSSVDVPLHTFQLPLICQEVFDDDAVIVIDGGNTAVWGTSFHEVRTPGAHLMTYKLGMLGAGVGQALGAKAAFPDRQVYCIIGDGAMGFHMQEIETAVRNKMPVIFLVAVDKQWGMVKFSQGMALNPQGMMEKRILPPPETINTDFNEIAFDKLAEAMGAHGERVDRHEDLKPALERAIKSGKCAVIHLDVDPVEHIWAPGFDTFKAMHQEPAG